MGNVIDKKQEKSRAQGVPDAPRQLAVPRRLREGVQRLPGGLAKGKLAGADDVLYWAKDTFGLKPVVSAYHATFYKSPRGA